MRQIKRFTGCTPPVLKAGEWASNDFLAFLGTGDGNYKMFQGALDLQKDQIVAGFELKSAHITIPSGTPFSRLQELFNTLPKVSISNKYQSSVLYLDFEAGTYVNDMNKWLQIKNFQYNIIVSALGNGYNTDMEKAVILQSTHAVEVYGSFLRFKGIRFEYEGLGGAGAAYQYNASVDFYNCAFVGKRAIGAFWTEFHSSVNLKECSFQMFDDRGLPLFNKIEAASKVFVRDCVASSGIKGLEPIRVADSLKSSSVTVNNEMALGLTEECLDSSCSTENYSHSFNPLVPRV